MGCEFGFFFSAIPVSSLHRPEGHNALNEEMIEALRQAAERAESEREARVVLLSGEGPSFCAGADVAWMKEMGSAGEEENRRSAERLAHLYLALHNLSKPLVGRIHGAVMGGGVGLCAVCDIAIAAETTRFALSEVRLGVIPGVIAPYLIRKVGRGRAPELILTARRLDGRQAEALGLVSQAVDESLLDSTVEGVISRLRAGGPRALSLSKDLLREIESSPRTGKELAELTARLTAEARSGDEARAGLGAFLDKTTPPWRTTRGRP